MMRIRKIGVILLIAFTIRLSFSCCDCPPTISYKYTFDAIELFHIDNSGQTPVITDSGIIPKEAYGLQIECSLGQLAFHQSSGFASFNSLYAVDCFCPPDFQYVAQDTISAIKILCLNDFDSTHPANSEICDYFKVLTYITYHTLQQFIDYPENIYYERPEKEVIAIYLMQAPTITGEHRFQVEIELSNGTTLNSTSTPISLE
jgi:hypothetical protein